MEKIDVDEFEGVVATLMSQVTEAADKGDLNNMSALMEKLDQTTLIGVAGGLAIQVAQTRRRLELVIHGSELIDIATDFDQEHVDALLPQCEQLVEAVEELSEKQHADCKEPS